MKTAVKVKQETLAPNAFIGKKEQPTEAELASTLGPAKPLWDKAVAAVMSECPELVPQWQCSSPKLGWGLRLQHKKRNIVHFSPCVGSFRAGFVLGERALGAVSEAGLPRRIVDLIAAAPKYVEGTGVRMEVREGDVEAICRLARIKMGN